MIMLISFRNRINHFILNWLLIMRYRARNRPNMIKLLMMTESACVRSGLIFNREKET